MKHPSTHNVGWLTLIVALLLAACTPATTAAPLPLADDRPTFLYFYTDG